MVGLGAGLIVALFRSAFDWADTLRNVLVDWSQQFPMWVWMFPLPFSMTGAVLSVFLVIRCAPEAKGSGIPHIKAVMRCLRTLQWMRVLPVKFVSGALSIGGGLALGREGPTVQMGGAVGAAISGWFKVPPREKRTLIAAGAGAGLAAAFNAPLAGVMFVLEEMTGDYQLMLPLLISCFCAYAVAEFPKDSTIYEALPERDLVIDGSQISIKEPMVIDFEIEQDAPISGQEVKMLGLPPGCLIIRCVEEGREFIPTTKTRLEAHMRITAVISPEASESLAILCRGCGGKCVGKA